MGNLFSKSNDAIPLSLLKFYEVWSKQTQVIDVHVKNAFLWTKSHNSATATVKIDKMERYVIIINPKAV